LEEIKKEERGSTMRPGLADARAFVRALLKAVAAAITLGTGNSLGPEGPSVEIGASIANGVGTVLNNSRERKLSLVAAGSAAGISSGQKHSNFQESLLTCRNFLAAGLPNG
jgi:hypothetical protein